MAEAFLTNDMTKLSLAEIEEYRMSQQYNNENNGDGQSFDIETLIVQVERGLGFMIDRKNMSVDTFYKHLTIFVKDGKKNTK